MTDNPQTDRIPLTHSVRYAVRGLPEVPNQYGPGTLEPREITITYRAAPDSQLGRVHAYVAGRIWVDGAELPLLPGGLYGQHYDDGLDGWPEWLAEEARLHDPAATPAVPVPPTTHATDRAALVEVAAQAIRDSNGTPEALKWWRTHPQLIPAHVYAAAVLDVLPPPADRAAVLRDLIAKAEEWDGHITVQELRRMADEAQQQPDTETPTVVDRAALSEKLWQIAEHHIIAQWICCEPINPEHDLCMQGDATLRMVKALLVDDPETWRPAPLLDAVLAVAGAEQADVRAAVLREAADYAEATAELLRGQHEFERSTGALDVMTVLRRLTSEAAADEQSGDLVEGYLRFLRGQGPEPDLSQLSPEQREVVVGRFEIVKALADRDPELPPLDRDPVALRLGLCAAVPAAVEEQQPVRRKSCACGQDGCEYCDDDEEPRS